ncbi:MAG TPA: glycosyltransferase WbuB [Rhodospirillaceae bacterium]|nr:MAG: hypothetical protein A2018_07500 [Alphaproteobacteria bacterium GWF2_58_20]HAU28706.1 glycosyltransferase WbuB [Rhodospirillaceae bacterium]
MRILIHDYPGYAFPVELARALAHRGHVVCHVHFSATIGPKGTLARMPDDPETLEFLAIGISGTYRKYSLLHRFLQERAYARRLEQAVRAFSPEVVISNAQPDIQARLLATCQDMGIPLVHWLQDLYSTAIGNILKRKCWLLGALAGAWYRHVEKRLISGCAQVVCISDAFASEMKDWGIPDSHVVRIDNWAPLADIPVMDQDNPWSGQYGLAGVDVVLYAGTLGWKHNPALLENLALALKERPKTRLVVASEGLGASWLAERKVEQGLDNLVLLPYQPEESFAAMLASAKVLLAILEPDASAYSAPSKILSYLCAGRPVVVSFPPENHSAQLLSGARAGIVCSSGDDAGFIAAVKDLLDKPENAADLAINGRMYAERHFRIDEIVCAFERVLNHA